MSSNIRGNTVTRKSRRGKRKSKAVGAKILLLLLLGAGLTLAIHLLKSGSYFQLKQISVTEAKYIDQTSLDSLVNEIFLGSNMLSSFKQEKSELEKHPLIKKIKLLRKFPNSLRIVVQERQPLALVNAGQLLAVDASGYVLPIDVSHFELELPIIALSDARLQLKKNQNGSIRLGKNGLQLLQAVQAFESMAPELLSRVSELSLSSAGKITLVTLDHGLRVVMGQWIEEKNISYFKWMLNQLEQQEEIPALVDLSFEGQIVVKRKSDG